MPAFSQNVAASLKGLPSGAKAPLMLQDLCRAKARTLQNSSLSYQQRHVTVCNNNGKSKGTYRSRSFAMLRMTRHDGRDNGIQKITI
jgi:hypothetical protein